MRLLSSEACGFTLIETYVALFILVFGLMSGAELIALTSRASSLARSKGSAAIVGESKLVFLADLYRRNPNAADLSPGDHGPEEIEIWNRAADCTLNRYRISWTVATVPDPRPGRNSGATQVWVTIDPSDTKGIRHIIPWLNKKVTLSTVLSARFL